MERKIPDPPKILAAPGRAFWRMAWSEWDWATAERERLLEVCRLTDRIEEFEQIIVAEGLVVGGKPHLLLPQQRADRRLRDQLIGRLGFVEADGRQQRTGWQARAAAAHKGRWGSQRDELARLRASRGA